MAADKTFTSSGQILPGETWDNVSVYNDSTVVDVLGGTVYSIGAHNSSTVNVSDGLIGHLGALEFSKVNVSGCYVYDGLSAEGNGTITFSGTASAVGLSSFDLGNIIMIGDSIEFLTAGYTSKVYLYGGAITDSLSAWNSATVNIFGNNLTKTPTGGSYGYGRVYGYWQDWIPFNINLNGSETYSHINLIPEPASVILFSFGALMLRRKRKNN
jgi:hypothetical protein